METFNGYIKLYRKLRQWGWYSDSVVKDVFIHLLMIANWKDGTYMGHELHAGDAVVGRRALAAELGFSEQQIRTALKKLESTKEIVQKTTNRFTIVTVVNWAFYQGEDEESNQQITNNQPTDNQQITNNQPHLKKEKNNKNNKNNPPTPLLGVAAELLPTVEEFIAYRKEIKKPMTERAIAMMIRKLDRLSDGDVEKSKEILEQSIINGWQGVFPLDRRKKTDVDNEEDADDRYAEDFPDDVV